MGRSGTIRISRARVIVPMAVWLVAFSLILFQVCFVQFKNYEIEDCIEYAHGINELVVDALDADRIDEFIDRGHDASGYDEIEAYLYKLRAAYPDVEYLYVYRIMEDGCHVVFDLDTPELKASEPGDFVEFDESFEDKLPDLLAGKEVDPVVSNDTFGYLLTVYTPVYDSTGRCTCYAAVDFSMGEIRSYVLKVVLHVAEFAVGFVLVSIVFIYFFADRGFVKPMKRMVNKAYGDALTGVGNKASYAEHATELDDDIAAGRASFVLLMVDVNFLKRINDTYGHEKGDAYLLACVDAMNRAFGKKHMYRYGGDEFVVMLDGIDEDDAKRMVDAFKDEVRRKGEDHELAEWERISAAVGMASFDPSIDNCVEDVLKRADVAMYDDKRAMKAERRD